MSIKLDNNAVTEDMMNQYRLSMTPDAIPDLDEYLKHINEMLEFIETPHMTKLKKNNEKEYEKLVFGKYNAHLPTKLIRLMLEDDRYDHLAKLLDMFDTLNAVKQGKKDIQDEFKKFSENLNEKYVYPLHGGKENFEKKMNELKKTKMENNS